MNSDLRQSREWGKFLTSQGWEIKEIRNQRSKIKIYIKKIPLIGSVIKIQRPAAVPPVKMIDEIARKHRALFIKLEPLTIVHRPLTGFAPDPTPCLPTKTVIIDLTKPEKELWQNLSQDARQSIRKAESKQLSVISYQSGNESLETGLTGFHQLLKRAGRRTHFWPPGFKALKAKADAFGKNAILFLAHQQSTKTPDSLPRRTRIKAGRNTGQPTAGALILIHDGTAYYHHAASSKEGQKLYAPYLLMWEIMKRAKSLELRALNLEGVYDPRYHRATQRWQGFSVFKKKFGGAEIEFPPPLIKYCHPLTKSIRKLLGLSN